jgi:hypothetical protein
MIAALSILSVSLLIAVAAVASISAARIKVSRDEAQARLADSFVSEAHARRVAGEPGHRAAALAQISEAHQLDLKGRLRHRLRRKRSPLSLVPTSDASPSPTCPRATISC